jgi:UDP-glucose 4-epimerase
MRILVTGGAGFIGSHVVDALRTRGHEVAVVDNLESGSRDNLPPQVPLHVVDIRDETALAAVYDAFRPEAVCHQAAQMSVSRSVREPVYDAEVNVLGLLRVFAHAVRVGARRIVFASSGGVLYGDVTAPAGEDHPAAPISPYGISKWVGEQYLQFFVREHGLTGVALRYSNVYGPRQNPHGEAGVVAIFSRRLLAGQPATINGDGRYIRDYVYGPDVAQANVLALETEVPEGFLACNIGTGVPADVNTLAGQVRGHCQACWDRAGRRGTVPELLHGPPRPGDLRSNLLSPQRAGRRLGWTPTVSLEDGLRRTVEWFAERVAVDQARHTQPA